MDKQSKKSNLVRKYVCSLIEQGLRFGDLLPSVSDICATLHISRMTVLRTLRQMEEEGIVECHKRSGTYVGKAVLYQINPVTIQRKRHSTGKKTITLFSPEPHSSEFAKEIFDGVSAILEDDYILVKHHYYVNKCHEDEEFINATASSDGMILIPSYPAGLRFAIHKALSSNYPLVFIDCLTDDIFCNFVGMNNTHAVFTLMNKLYDMGHREIGFFCNNPQQNFTRSSVKMRYEAYKIFMRQKKLNPFLFSSPEMVVQDWKKQYINPVSALVCNNDNMAYELYDILKKAGIRVPQDISLTGIDDLNPQTDDQIKITTIRQPKLSIGLQAGLLMKELLEHPENRNRLCNEFSVKLRILTEKKNWYRAVRI